MISVKQVIEELEKYPENATVMITDDTPAGISIVDDELNEVGIIETEVF